MLLLQTPFEIISKKRGSSDRLSWTTRIKNFFCVRLVFFFNETDFRQVSKNRRRQCLPDLCRVFQLSFCLRLFFRSYNITSLFSSIYSNIIAFLLQLITVLAFYPLCLLIPYCQNYLVAPFNSSRRHLLTPNIYFLTSFSSISFQNTLNTLSLSSLISTFTHYIIGYHT